MKTMTCFKISKLNEEMQCIVNTGKINNDIKMA